MTKPSKIVTTLWFSMPLVSLISGAAPLNKTSNFEKMIQKKPNGLRQQLDIPMPLTQEETSDNLTSSPAEISDISSFSLPLEVLGNLAALPILAISPFLLLGLAIFLLPLLAASSLILILMVLAGSAAVMVPLILGIPVLFLPLLLLVALDGEQLNVLPEGQTDGSGLSEDAAAVKINISDLISTLLEISTEKDDDLGTSSFTSTFTTNVDDSLNFNVDDKTNSIPHSAVPRLLSW